MLDKKHIAAIVQEYRRHGFRLALDDFGAGYSSLSLLADLSTDILKRDMELTRDLPLRPTALAIVKAVVALADSLGTELVAEGIETVEEYEAVRDCGIHLMQGYLFAKPAFEALPEVCWPGATVRTADAARCAPGIATARAAFCAQRQGLESARVL